MCPCGKGLFYPIWATSSVIFETQPVIFYKDRLPFQEKKTELDVKESFLVFKIWCLRVFLTFNIHIIDFLLLGFYPLKITSCTCLHQNLLCDTLTVTRNVNFALSLFIEINSISFIRNCLKKCTLLECQCIQHESTNWEHYFYVSYRRGDRHFTWSSQPREGLGIFRAKEVPSILNHFKTMSVGPVAGFELWTELILLRLTEQ